MAEWVGELPSGARLLELGAGSGQIRSLVSRPDLRWTALEGDLAHLGELRAFGAAAVANLDAMDRLPMADAVLAGDVLEHLSNPQATLAAAFAALPAGGVLLLSVPNVANLTIRLALLAGRFDYRDRGILDRTHRTFFTRKTLRRFLVGAGFIVTREAATPLPVQLALPAWPRLAGVLGRAARVLTALRPTVFGYQLLVRAARLDSPPGDECVPSHSLDRGRAGRSQ